MNQFVVTQKAVTAAGRKITFNKLVDAVPGVDIFRTAAPLADAHFRAAKKRIVRIFPPVAVAA
jgi:hypothetical protein